MKLRFSIVFFLMMTVIGQNVIAASNYNDMRVVIDVSGSINKNGSTQPSYPCNENAKQVST